MPFPSGPISLGGSNWLDGPPSVDYNLVTGLSAHILGRRSLQTTGAIERCSSKTGFGGASGDLTLDEEIRVVNILKVPMSTTGRWDRGSGKETGAHTRRCQCCLA